MTNSPYEPVGLKRLAELHRTRQTEHVEHRNGTICVNGRMLVGQSLFDYVALKRMERDRRLERYGQNPSPYDAG